MQNDLFPNDLFPETLYETYTFEGVRICLVCGSRKATSVLRSTDREIVPLCERCAVNWNFYGYECLKKVKPKELIKRLAWYKLRHFFTTQSVKGIYAGLNVMKDWAAKMKKFAKRHKET